MTTEEIEKQILLHQSGELPAAQIDELLDRLKQDPQARAFQEDLLRITEAECNLPEEAAVSALTLERIYRAAKRTERTAPGRRRQGRVASPPFLALWRPALVYAAAACVLLLLGLRFVHQHQLETAQVNQVLQELEQAAALLAWDDDWDEVVSEWGEILEMASVNQGADSDWESTLAGGDSVDEIAEELMRLEGWNI